MSVQNGERLATKQDLADMYQGILPYLGGMPEMLANKFSKGDLYSTDEKMIGQWVNGKPLYQRVFTDLSITTGTSDNVAKLTGCVVTNAERLVNAIFLMGSDSAIGDSYIYKVRNVGFTSSGEIRFVTFGTDDRTITRIIVQYTKSTDSAISIGSDTDYSTEEKIVGTWIDGSPVYQKYYPSRLTLSVDMWVDTGIPTGSISKIISVEAYTDSGTAINSISSSCNGTNIKIYSPISTTLSDVHGFTLRYTKTT